MNSGDSSIRSAVKNSYVKVKSGDGVTDEETADVEPPSSNGVGNGISKGEVFEILSHERRRYILHYLKQNSDRADVGEMSRQIAAWENEIGFEDVTLKQRKRLYTALYQSHLPKMDDAGILNYDQESGTVELTKMGSELDVYLELVPSGDINWAQYYLGLATLSTALIITHFIGVYPFTLPSSTVAAVVVTAFAVSAFVHAYQNKRNKLGGSGTPPDAGTGNDLRGGDRA